MLWHVVGLYLHNISDPVLQLSEDQNAQVGRILKTARVSEARRCGKFEIREMAIDARGKLYSLRFLEA